MNNFYFKKRSCSNQTVMLLHIWTALIYVFLGGRKPPQNIRMKCKRRHNEGLVQPENIYCIATAMLYSYLLQMYILHQNLLLWLSLNDCHILANLDEFLACGRACLPWLWMFLNRYCTCIWCLRALSYSESQHFSLAKMYNCILAICIEATKFCLYGVSQCAFVKSQHQSKHKSIRNRGGVSHYDSSARALPVVFLCRF